MLNKRVKVGGIYLLTLNKIRNLKIIFFTICTIILFISIYELSFMKFLAVFLMLIIFKKISSIFRTYFDRLLRELRIRESLLFVLDQHKLYEIDKNGKIIRSSTLIFKADKQNIVTVYAPLSGDRWTKQLKNLEENLTAALALPLISKKELPSSVVYKFGNIEKIEQYVFNSHTLTREFFVDIPSQIVKLSKTQEFSLKSNTNIGIYGRTGSGKTIALQWFLFNALAKGCGINDNTYLGIVDGKGADLYALGTLLQEELGEQISVGSSPTSLAKLSRQFVEMMNERFEVIKQNSTLNADAYDLGMTPNFLFVDELASIRDSCGLSKQGKELWSEILKNLGLIARKGRQAGCHLVLSTQDPNSENISVELRLQITSVLYLNNSGKDRLKMAFSMCELENVPIVSGRKGEALFFADGLNISEPIITIVPFVDIRKKQEFLQIVKNILPPKQ